MALTQASVNQKIAAYRQISRNINRAKRAYDAAERQYQNSKRAREVWVQRKNEGRRVSSGMEFLDDVTI